MADTTRPLALRMRPDLVVSTETFGGRSYAVLKDPLALRYFRVKTEEFALLELLDGRRSLDDVRVALEAQFAPQTFATEDLSQFVARMHEAGLVVSELPGQAAPLLSRRRKAKRRAWLQTLMSPMAIRVRGLDPTRAFDVVYPRVRWCFTKTAAVAATLLVVAALSLFAVYHVEVLRRLPSWQEFFTPTNMLLLLALMAGIKILHEFGHGLACRHFGGEVHELGLMFLVFATCLYCNVSDSWRLPKRARIFVGAAGILVEVVLASLAVFGWWFSQPGLFNQLCLGTMFVSGVSTILINGNPLLRYDGYFILADVWEMPNLAERATTTLRRALARVCLGVDDREQLTEPERHPKRLIAYAVASAVYRWFITFSIALFMIAWLRPYRLEVIARAMTFAAVLGLTVPSLWRFVRYASAAGVRAKFQRGRTLLTTVGVVGVVAALVLVPLPQCVWGTLEVEPRDVERIYVDVPGLIAKPTARPGDRVAAGDVVCELQNVDLELEIAKLEGQAAGRRAELDSLRRQRYHGTQAALRIPEVEKALAAIEELLVEKRAEAARLVLRSSRGGIVFPSPETPAPRETALGELPTWSGLPTDPENRGAALGEGTLFCQVGDARHWQALVVIDQSDVNLLELGQTVEIRFDEMPNVVVAAQVDEISRHRVGESPRHLSNKVGGELATSTDAAGVERPVSATYQVRVSLYDPGALLRIGVRGTARIHVPAEPLGTRLARWVSRTFYFQL